MKRLIAVALVCACAGFTTQAQKVGINTTNPDASAALMIDTSSTKQQGILIPRMALFRRSAFSSPATGLLIYQTDNTPGFNYNAGTPTATNWQLVGGQPLPDGTAAGEVYLTGSAPYSPNVPQTVTGDISLNPSAVATITTSAVTTAKIADGAVTSSKIANSAVDNSQPANNSVPIPKISATGTPSVSTYLRGDGNWADPASSTGVAPIANLSAGQILSLREYDLI